MASPVTSTDNLAHIYPNVGAELCNRHVKQLSKLKCLFADIYDEMQPEAFIIVNGIAKVIDLGSDLQLNFALENGITLLYSKTYKNEDIFINGNHIEEQILFNSKGRHQDGIHEKIDQIKDLIKSIRKSAAPGKEFYGGIIYLHTNIGENLMGYNECFMIALTIGLLLIHEELHHYSQQSLIELVTRCDAKSSLKLVSNIIKSYEINKIMTELYVGNNKEYSETSSDFNLSIHNPNSDKSIGTFQSIKNFQNEPEPMKPVKTNNEIVQSRRGSKNSAKTRESRQSIESLQFYGEVYRQQLRQLNIKLKQNHKLILCKMDISKDEQTYYNDKMQSLRLVNQALKQRKTHKSQLINGKGEVKIPLQLRQAIRQDQNHLVEYCEEVRSLVTSLINKNIEFDDFITEKHNLDIEYRIHDDGVIDLLDDIRRQTKYIQNFCILEGTVLLLSIDRQYYTEIVSMLRKLLNEYRFSTYRYLQTMKKMTPDEKYTDISEVMFTTMPSLGCAIYRPTEEAWI